MRRLVVICSRRAWIGGYGCECSKRSGARRACHRLTVTGLQGLLGPVPFSPFTALPAVEPGAATEAAGAVQALGEGAEVRVADPDLDFRRFD